MTYARFIRDFHRIYPMISHIFFVRGGVNFLSKTHYLGWYVLKKRHFAYDVNVRRIDSNAGVDAYVFAGPVSGPDFQSEVVDQQFKDNGLVT